MKWLFIRSFVVRLEGSWSNRSGGADGEETEELDAGIPRDGKSVLGILSALSTR